MGHIKIINHTGQPIHIKAERDQSPEALTFECEDLNGEDIPVNFDRKSGRAVVTKTDITITAKKEV